MDMYRMVRYRNRQQVAFLDACADAEAERKRTVNATSLKRVAKCKECNVVISDRMSEAEKARFNMFCQLEKL